MWFLQLHAEAAFSVNRASERRMRLITGRIDEVFHTRKERAAPSTARCAGSRGREGDAPLLSAPSEIGPPHDGRYRRLSLACRRRCSVAGSIETGILPDGICQVALARPMPIRKILAAAIIASFLEEKLRGVTWLLLIVILLAPHPIDAISLGLRAAALRLMPSNWILVRGWQRVMLVGDAPVAVRFAQANG